MAVKLNERDKRAIRTGALGVLVILLVLAGMEWLDHWSSVRENLQSKKQQINSLRTADIKRQTLAQIVPVFEMPKTEEEQKFLFRDKFNQQLKEAKVKSEPVKFFPGGSSRLAGYRLLRLECDGQTEWQNMLDLLSNLNTNPYLVSIEHIAYSCDQKERKKIKLNMIITTAIK